MNYINSRQSKLIAIVITISMIFTCFTFTQTDSAKAAAGKKAPYSGGSIKGTVFYIAVDADGNGSIADEGDALYYYTLAEIKAAGEEVEYHYGNHGQGETANVKGAKLQTLLDNTTGVTFQDSWKIQYMEEDAYHAMSATYIDTIQGLTDEDGIGNGSGAENGPAETIIGYCSKTTYDAPDQNNVNETVYTDFADCSREASHVRAYRQTNSANSSVMKLLKGVVITSAEQVKINGQCGYTIESKDIKGNKIASDYTVKGLIEGMKWEAEPTLEVYIPWADLNSSQDGNFNGTAKTITAGKFVNKTAEEIVEYEYTETPFFSINQDGRTAAFKRSNLAAAGSEAPSAKDNTGAEYTYYGYNKPMYVRYQGVWLNEYMSVPAADEKVYIVRQDGSIVDITDRADDFFVAYYYTQSKSSSNISNNKRVPLNYAYSVLVDTASATVEYSNDNNDYTPISGKTPTTYENAKVIVTNSPAKVSGVKAVRSEYNAVKVSWNKVGGAAGYEIYRSTASGSGYSKVKTVTNGNTVSYTDKGLKTGTKYFYKVKAYKTADGTKFFGQYSDVKSAVPTLSKTSVKLSKRGKRAVKVKWTNVSGENGYKVYRSVKKNSGFKCITTVKANKTSYVDKKTKKGRAYYYKVKAYKKVGSKTVYAPASAVKKIKR